MSFKIFFQILSWSVTDNYTDKFYSLSVEGAVSAPIAFGTSSGATIQRQILHYLYTLDVSLENEWTSWVNS